MFGSKVLPVPHQVLHISKPTFSPFFPRAHILHISASLTSTQFLSGPRKSRWFIILPGVNFTCPFDAIQHRCYEKLLLSAAELKLIPAKKCHLFGGDKNRGLSHLKRNVNPWIMRIKRWLINVKSCTLIWGGGGTGLQIQQVETQAIIASHLPSTAFDRDAFEMYLKNHQPESEILPATKRLQNVARIKIIKCNIDALPSLFQGTKQLKLIPCRTTRS